jgi:hypothetical protein
MDEKWIRLLTSRKVWLALVGIGVAVSQALGLGIPAEVFAAIEGLITAVIVAIGIEDHGLRASGR